jgi:hypothetical protein
MITAAQTENKRQIKLSMLETVRDNIDMASFYAKKKCKDCIGRGVVTRSLPHAIHTSQGSAKGWKEQRDVCHCVIKTIDKEATSAVKE